jgi:archaetidylinositol phosphate synthase
MSSTTMQFRSAIRQQDSILTRFEKPALIWLARRMPDSINSDHLTLLGFLGMAGAGLSYYFARQNELALLGVIVCLALNWFGDSLDGTLARVRQRQRPRYGFYVDHIIDTFGALLLFGGLALSGYMTPSVAITLLVVYFMLSIELYLAAHTVGVFRLSFGYWGPTELRVLLIIGNLVLLTRPAVTIAARRFLLFDVGGVVAIAGISVILITSVIRNTHRLYVEERIS